MTPNVLVYNNNKNLKAAGVKLQFTEEQVAEYLKCAEDPLYFIENYAKVVSLDKGIVPFVPFPYQRRLVKAMHENRNTIGLLGRQMGKSAIVAGYFAWYMLFNEHKTAAILANKQAVAVEIFGRVQFIIENLPKWLQQGVTEWNKTSFILENGCRCFAAASSPSAVRGFSVSLLFCVRGDTEITIRNKKTGEVKRVRIEDLQNLNGINTLSEFI